MQAMNCKMCGNKIEVAHKKGYEACVYCGNTVTLPRFSDEESIALYNRGNQFRQVGEFDKASAVFEKLMEKNGQEPEVHWCSVLSRYGIVYEEDKTSFEWKPLCYRAVVTSILDDVDYIEAIQHSTGTAKRQYQRDAAQIAEVQQRIVRGAQGMPEYDVMICHKMDDDDHELAQMIAAKLSKMGYAVYIDSEEEAETSLEEKEAHILSALNSAKVMLVVGTKGSNMEDALVRNVWMRYCNLMARAKEKNLLVCYGGMEAYDIPEELVDQKALDANKQTFWNALCAALADAMPDKEVAAIETEAPAAEPEEEPAKAEPVKEETPEEPKKSKRPKKKTEPVAEPVTEVETPTVEDIATLEPEPEPEPVKTLEDYLAEGAGALAQGDFAQATALFTEAVNMDPSSGQAYYGLYLSQNGYRSDDEFCGAILQKINDAEPETAYYPYERQELLSEAVEKYGVPYYFDEGKIGAILDYSGEYISYTNPRKDARDGILASFESSMQLAKACDPAAGTFGTTVQGMLRGLIDKMQELIVESENEDKKQLDKLKKEFENHYKQAMAEIETTSQELIKQRDQDYLDSCSRAAEASTVEEFAALVDEFDKFEDYNNAVQMKAHCQNRLDEIRNAASDKKKMKQKIVGGVVAAVVVVAAVIAVPRLINNSKGDKQVASGNYEQATEAYNKSGNEEKAMDTIKKQVEELEASSSFEQAKTVIEENFEGDAKEEMMQQYYAAQAEYLTIDATTTANEVEQNIELVTDETIKEKLQNKLDAYYYDKGNEAADQGDFDTALEVYDKVVSANRKIVDKKIARIKKAQSKKLYPYTTNTFWKVSSCTVNGRKTKKDATNFTGVHSKIDEDQIVYYATFNGKNIVLSSYNNIKKVKVKAGKINYTMSFSDNKLTIKGKNGKKNIVCELKRVNL